MVSWWPVALVLNVSYSRLLHVKVAVCVNLK